MEDDEQELTEMNVFMYLDLVDTDQVIAYRTYVASNSK